VAADLVGFALVASTSVSTYSQRFLENLTFAYSSNNPNGFGPDEIEYVFTSGGSYPSYHTISDCERAYYGS
jgi:hypothetical protein